MGTMNSCALRACLVAGLALASTAACRRSAPEAPPQPASAPATIEVLKGGRWLFTYVEPNGTFATTDKPDSVPAQTRAIARVFDPADTTSKTNVAGQVYVTNINELLKGSKAAARPLSREAFETAALAQLPPGQSSALASHHAAPEPEPAAVDAGVATLAPGQVPVVTVYGTSWCGACRAARQYFTEKKIPFADKDVERDPAAARELADKAAKMGVPTDRVPVIDVRGRLLLGFDRARIEALLGEST
jgi:glutaredoxin